MLVLLVRHGHAGAKRQWHGDDESRPLDATGLGQATGLVSLLAPFEPARVVSSPFLRCVQTVTPMSEALGVPIERSPSLVPEAGTAARRLAQTVTVEGPGAIVLCTHGEVIHDMQAQLAHEGLAGFSPASSREKGSVWVLDRTDGRFTGAHYLAPAPSA
jgi:broad specificity phosphatase PhoE